MSFKVDSIRVQYKEVDGTRFYYADVGSEVHGRYSFRLWISGRLVKQVVDKDGNVTYLVTFPVKDAAIVRTEKGTLVLRPVPGKVTHNILVPCGYRGTSSIQVDDMAGVEVYTYYVYESPRGNLGISTGALIVANDVPVFVNWSRSGRLYGVPDKGVLILYPDGDTYEREACECLDGLPDREELEELKELLS
jgi:hypothetical protein